MQIITLQEVEYLTLRLAQEHLSFDEPIPDFSSLFPNVLESCILAPFQRFSRRTLYPSLVSRASILFYLMIKDRPFQNGNKRIAMTTLLVFLYKNNKWLRANMQELYNLTVWVAQSPAAFKRQVVEAIKEFVRSHLVNLNKRQGQ